MLHRLRQKSREEIEWQGYTTDQLLSVLPGQRIAWTIYNDTKPAALIGAIPKHSGVWTLFGLGTDEWINIWRLVTLVAKRDMMKEVSATGAHRAHCLSPESHEDTHRWLRFLGATHEAEMPAYGVNGEDFRMFTWLREGA